MPRKISHERRCHQRAKRVLAIYHRLSRRATKAFGGPWRVSTTQDMCVGGILFISDFAYRPKDIVELRVVMSGALDIFDGFGKVVRVVQRSPFSFYQVAVTFQKS